MDLLQQIETRPQNQLNASVDTTIQRLESFKPKANTRRNIQYETPIGHHRRQGGSQDRLVQIVKLSQSQFQARSTNLEVRKTIQACRSTASFIDKQIERDIDEDRESESFQDSDAVSDDQENAVYTIAKGKDLDSFINSLTEEQNRLFLQSTGKYFVPTLLCNLASDLSASCLLILRNCDLL